MEHNKNIVDQFTKQAVPFAEKMTARHDGLIQLMLSASGATGKDTVLDVACGPGLVACAFAQVASHVTGIDLTPAMIERARLLQVKHNLSNLRWEIGDVLLLPYPDGAFSITVTRFSFHHFLNPVAVLQEMIRVTRPGGRVVISDVYTTEDMRQSEAYNGMEKLRDPSHVRALPLSELQNMLQGAGLRNVRTEFFKLEMELEEQLRASFPNPGDDEKIRQIFRDDLESQTLGMETHLRKGEIHLAYPVAVISGNKETEKTGLPGD
jgi:ubiquinone/menaquinone biosynthesis C-methylase UbiE